MLTMTTATPNIERLDDAGLPDFLSAERALLLLTGAAGQSSERLLAELDAACAAGALPGVSVGTLDLSSADAMLFVAFSDWLAEIPSLPYVALYRGGRRVEGFAATRADTVLARVQRLAFASAPAPLAFPAHPSKRADAA